MCRFCERLVSDTAWTYFARLTYSAGMRKKMRPHGLDVAVVGLAELSQRLEVLLACPALRQDGERQVHLHRGHVCVQIVVAVRLQR